MRCRECIAEWTPWGALGKSSAAGGVTSEGIVIRTADPVRSLVHVLATTCAASAVVGALVGEARAQAPAATTTDAAASSPAAGPVVDPAVVPTYMDVVQRGLRARLDLGGRYGAVGLPDPPVRLELDDVVQDRNDLDIQGTVILGYDRMFGAPLQGDVFGDFNLDANPDSPVSPYLDDQSQGARLRLYSAFIGLSASPGEPGLRPFFANVGRMTEIVESPLTYDGVSVGARLRFGRSDQLNARLWGGLDAPQRLANDPFSRTSNRAYAESYVLDDQFVSSPGSVYVQRTAITDPILNPVGGLAVDGRFAGIGFVLAHTMMPAQTDWGDGLLLPLQRSTLGVSYRYDSDFLLVNAGLDSKFTDFLPRNATLRADALTGDGTTRVGLVTRLQFLEDIAAYDGTFRALNPQQAFDFATAEQLEALRVRDQIRHLNFGPPQEHFYASAEVERQIIAGFQASARGRLRQHFDAADVDMFRTNFFEGGLGVSWNPGFALDIGTEVVVGAVDSGQQNGLAYDLNAEGVVSYLEPRLWVRGTLLGGRLRNLTEVFARRNDVQTKALQASGQWGGALATTTTYDIFDNWSASVRLDGDALSPVDSLNATTYFGALVASSVRF
jgi:hypothetical protein